MPIIYAQKLQDLLQKQGRSLEIFTTPEDQKKFQQHFKDQGAHTKPIYSGGVEAAYVEIKNVDLLIVKSELEKMGFPLVVQDNQGDFRPEYLCVLCKYKSDDPGYCPEHKMKLIEFSEWVALKNKPKNYYKVLKYLFVDLILALVVWVYYTSGQTGHIFQPSMRFR